MHYAAYYALRDMVQRHVDPFWVYKILDLGGLDVNSTKYGLDIRKFFPRGSFWRVLDIVDAPGVDFVADVRTWEPPELFDIVVSTEMLEHLENWPLAIETAAEALRGPEMLFITCASTGRPPHDAYGAPTPPPEGQFYENVAPDRLESVLYSHFRSVELKYDSAAGDVYAFAQGKVT